MGDTDWILTLFNIYPPEPTCPDDDIDTSFPLIIFLPLVLVPAIGTYRKRKKK